MAWRLSAYLVQGELDNTQPGRVMGWMQFAGMKDRVSFDLEGDFHRDIRGAKIRLEGDALLQGAEAYMQGFSANQTGKAGDITAGREPVDYVNYPYIEWYSHDNGRVVIELRPAQVELIGQPIPAIESDPVSRKQQAQNMAEFLCGIADAVSIPRGQALSAADTVAVEQAKKIVANDKIRGMKLLPQEIREQLPALYAQDGKGGKAVAHVKFFTPSSSWSWWATEGSPITDDAGREVDFQFFGLVEGHCRELGYFNLSELESVRGPMGLPIERDLYWRPKTLEEIAPEMFCRAGRWLTMKKSSNTCSAIQPPPEDHSEQPLYRVVYAIDVYADDPRSAAKDTHRIMADPESMPPVLHVVDHAGKCTTIDLSEPQG